MATLRSVNVGLPRDVEWRGRTVHTGIWKAPVDGPVTARRLNLDGDGQGDLGGHGGEMRAVFVYQLDSYRYWEKFLGRDDLVPGQFGENFTVDGLADDEVRVGDRYRIGAALFEVTQPRVTCYRVGIRMDDPRMPALLVQHHRPGFYFRVLEEGAVRAGDDIVRVAAGPEPITVAEVDALLYLPGHPRERIEQALRIPALSPGWQGSFRAMLDEPASSSGNAGLVAASPRPAWPGFRPLRVTAIDRESSTISSLRLADPDGTPLPAALPGQFLSVRLGSGLIRSYSLSGQPGGPDYRISVKREPHGAASAYLHTSVHPGDLLEAAAPRGTFVLAPGDGPVVLISGGVGATPVLAMLYALADQGSTREVWWVQAARNSDEQPFAAEARALLARLPRSRAYVCFSRPGPHETHPYDFAGRLSADVLRGLKLPADADAYVCGPASFLTDVTAALTGLRVHSEIFGAHPGLTPGIAAQPSRPPHSPAGEPGTGPAVAFARSGLTVPWPEDAGSLLDLAEACDVPVRWSCRVGVCHNCESGLLSGQVAYTTEPVDPPAEGSVLICSSRPESDIVLDL
ncbi:MOSC and FAD-binding oxidoreductase domain-containing protein [Actinoplanes sp. TRM 88003]|uniref:MOSC and FAD-binding oxidoreductase domain-containing protein n=1 Tax=Paractinoplanes aksuensis TaxID=2939490 RepID=A0ABT1E0Z1_9ACTN|nr:MOSC domain-containing protein [Actinoplanes aksuensis]MCO8276815.1 MOSC and FAD-binding oxidoreductase domain-containing protein [Actinoplanes aksuensis]